MRILKTLCLLCVLCMINLLVTAQTRPVSLHVYTSASFYYDFPQSPGAVASIEFPLNSIHVVSGKKEKFKDLVTSSSIGFYRYGKNNTGSFLTQSIGFRYRHLRPYFFEWKFMAGALRTFYDGKVYKVSDEGVVSTLPAFGRWYAMAGGSTEFGFDWEKSQKKIPLAVSIGPSLWIQFPYNNFVLPHLSIQLTFRYHFSSFNISVHQKEKRNKQRK